MKSRDKVEDPDVSQAHLEEADGSIEPLVQEDVEKPSETGEWYAKLLGAVQARLRCCVLFRM